MKNLKKSKGIALIDVILLLFIFIIGAILFKAIINGNSIENTKLSEKNFQETLDEYSKSENKSDNLAYVLYALMYNSVSDLTFNFFTNGSSNIKYPFSSAYGKTINELKKEGKELMKRNNVNVEDFKHYLDNL